MINQRLETHIDHAIPAKAHTQMYLMHKWWARKPHNVVSEYVHHYTQKGDIVLDPFSGSGVTALEAIKRDRKAIAVDLNPMSTFITRMTGLKLDPNQIKEEFIKIKNLIEDEILSYYATKCSNCNTPSRIICSIWNIKEKTPHEIRYECKKCKKKIHKEPDENDLALLDKINNLQITKWYPKDKLEYENNVEFKEGTHFEEFNDIPSLFTHRNLLALSLIYDAIISIKTKSIKEIFLLAFTSMVHLASKMGPDRPTRPYSSFWPVHRYWIPKENMESNVWQLFESVVEGRQGIVVGKEDSNDQIPIFNLASKIDDLKSKSNIAILNQSALDLSNIPNDFVDYVFTDPPYGGSIQYFELSTLWASWLNKNGDFILDFGGEVTINQNQKKDFDFYHNMLRSAFKEVFRVLKPEKYLTITFHNTDIKIYNSILKAVVRVGFDLEKVVYQPPARPSAKSLLQPFGSAIGDYYLRFKKPKTSKKIQAVDEIEKDRYEKIIVESIKKIIAERGEPTAYSYLINSYSIIFNELKNRGYLFSTPESIDDVLRKNLNKEFVIIEKTDEKGKLKAKLWWFKNPESISFIERVPLGERVQEAIISVLKRNFQINFDEILQEIFISFPNSLTPEISSIVNVLNNYAEKVKGGKWRLKPSVKDRANEHDDIVEAICVLGEKAGFEVYGDTKKRRKKLSFNVDAPKLIRIHEIDALWYKDGKISHSFEVENSTGITEAIVRGSNIEYHVKRFIIIPEERENLLSRKVKEPAIKDRIFNDNWMFIRYGDFNTYYHKNKRKRKIDPLEIDKLSKSPKSIKVEGLDNFL